MADLFRDRKKCPDISEDNLRMLFDGFGRWDSLSVVWGADYVAAPHINKFVINNDKDVLYYYF